MPTIVTRLLKQDVCPDIVLDNVTNYIPDTSHCVENFSDFVKLTLSLPNDIVITFGSSFPNIVNPPSQSLQYLYETCLTGKFTASFVALPSPPAVRTLLPDNLYNTGNNFYWNGVIYNIIRDNTRIPLIGQTNDVTIAQLLASGDVAVITEDAINPMYKVDYDFTHWCTLSKCLKDKLEKLNCLIVKEPTRMDICEMEEYEQAIQLNLLQLFVDTADFLNPYTQSSENDFIVKSMSNYINSICCCKKCDC